MAARKQRITLMTVGRRADPVWESLVEAYRRRLPVAYQWAWVRVPEVPAHGLTALEVRRREAENLERRLSPADWVVALAERGQELDSVRWADQWSRWLDGEGRTVVLVVGGAAGLSAEFLQRADWVWSLSRLTWPHEMVPVLVAEQLYRAYTIQHGHPYHKG